MDRKKQRRRLFLVPPPDFGYKQLTRKGRIEVSDSPLLLQRHKGSLSYDRTGYRFINLRVLICNEFVRIVLRVVMYRLSID